MATFYLSGRIVGLQVRQAVGWRRELKQLFGTKHKFIDPTEGLEAFDIPNRVIHPEDCPTGLAEPFTRSMDNILHCDVIIGNLLDGCVFGTPFELGAGWMSGKLIVLVTRASLPTHPFYSCAYKQFYTLKQLNQWLEVFDDAELPRISTTVDFSQYKGQSA